MIDKKYIVTTTTTYAIKYRFRTLRGKASACRNINDFSQVLVLYKELMNDEQICDIVVEEKIINVLDKNMLQNDILFR